MNPTLFVLRSNLEFSSQQHLGKNYIVVKDQLTKRYFRFTEKQQVILDLLHEPREVSWLARAVSERLGTPVSVETIQGFLASLEDKLLLDTELVRDKLVRYPGRPATSKNLLYWKIASLNPERIFAWLIPRTQWAFTRWFHAVAIAIIASGFILTYLHLNELRVSVYDLLSLHGLLLIWFVTLTVVTAHEFAHGLTCCHF